MHFEMLAAHPRTKNINNNKKLDLDSKEMRRINLKSIQILIVGSSTTSTRTINLKAVNALRPPSGRIVNYFDVF